MYHRRSVSMKAFLFLLNQLITVIYSGGMIKKKIQKLALYENHTAGETPLDVFLNVFLISPFFFLTRIHNLLLFFVTRQTWPW